MAEDRTSACHCSASPTFWRPQSVSWRRPSRQTRKRLCRRPLPEWCLCPQTKSFCSGPARRSCWAKGRVWLQLPFWTGPYFTAQCLLSTNSQHFFLYHRWKWWTKSYAQGSGFGLNLNISIYISVNRVVKQWNETLGGIINPITEVLSITWASMNNRYLRTGFGSPVLVIRHMWFQPYHLLAVIHELRDLEESVSPP